MGDPDTAVTSGHVRTGGAEIAYDVRGTGDPVVLLHAGIADRRMWDEQLDAFARHYRVVRTDLRGFGQTTCDRSPFAHHEDVDAVLGELGIDRAFLVGASLGAAVAVDVALHHPDRVSGLVLIGPAVDGARFEDPELLDGWARTEALVAAGQLDAAADLEIALWVAGPRRLPDELDDHLRDRVREMLVHSYGHETGDERDPPGPPAIERLDRLTVPTLVLVGKLDRPDILRIADVLADRSPAARLVGLAGVAHLPNLETPQRINRLVLEFLAEVQAGAFP